MLPPEQPESFEFRKLLPKFTFIGRRAPSSVLSTKRNFDKIVREAELSRFQKFVGDFRTKNSRFALISAGLGGVALVLAVLKTAEISKAEKEISRRKDQLAKPMYELKGNEASNFPWDRQNLDDWLYRPIKITGRPLHNKAMLVPRKLEGYHGFDYIVPLVTKENEDGSEQEGILLNKGWLPNEHYHVGNRFRIENALPQTFECYLSLNSELDEKGSFFKKGNTPGKGRNRWSHVYLPDMAKTSEFKNQGAVKLALLEAVNPESALDERNTKHYEMTLIGSEETPYPKTRAGALQLRTMPWDLTHERNTYATVGFILTGLAAALKYAPL
jgi:surfeit locus 1 family protein